MRVSDLASNQANEPGMFHVTHGKITASSLHNLSLAKRERQRFFSPPAGRATPHPMAWLSRPHCREEGKEQDGKTTKWTVGVCGRDNSQMVNILHTVNFIKVSLKETY